MKTLDCVVCGEACADLLVRPIRRDVPLSSLGTQHVDQIQAGTGGIVPNAGIALAKLGARVAAAAIVGNDTWGDLIRKQLRDAQVDTTHVVTHPSLQTSATAVLIDEHGEHSFAFYSGASREVDRAFCLERLDLFSSARLALFGYYHLFPHLEEDLPEVLAAIRETGCQTALDTANGGGHLQPLDRILRYLDLYVPSYAEARQQTGATDPQQMLQIYRSFGTKALLGIKLGDQGALLSPADGPLIRIPPVAPPGPLVDTTGAGDCFYAGLIRGLLLGMSVERAGRLGAATGACCVTGLGATAGLRDLDSTCALIPDEP